jgi:hypothetical protein
LELVAGWVAIHPYRCKGCGHRYLQFRYAQLPDLGPGNSAEREIRATRSALAWKRKRRELLLYGAGVLCFLAFLYFITRERGGFTGGG